MRGFLGGVAIGALVSGLGISLASLAVPLPQTVEVSSQEPVPTAAPESGPDVPKEAVQRDADLVKAAPIVSKDSPLADDLSAVVTVDSDPVLRPTVTSTVPEPSVSQPQLSFQSPVIGDSEPASLAHANLEQAQPEFPNAPTAETGPDVVTTPAVQQDPQPDVKLDVAGQTALADPALAAPAEQQGGQARANANNSGLEQIQDQETVIAALPSADLGAIATGDTGQAQATSPSATAPEPLPVTPVATPTLRGTLAPEIAPLPQVGLPDIIIPQVRPAPQNKSIEIETAAVVDTAQSKTPNRPGIGRPATSLVTQGQREKEAEAAKENATPDLDPVLRNAEEFIPADDRPLMSIVLLDSDDSVGAEALADFPYPLTFAIDPADPNAETKAEARRAAGFEVLMVVDLPRDAAPKDAEMAMEVWLPKFPLAVGVLEGVETGFQGNRALADQLSAVTGAGGLGLVTQAKGFNTVHKLAQREGIPSAVVFRDFDGAGQNPRAIRRFLDQAAFRANQEGSVIMLGRLQPDTISALLLWGLQDRASRVQLAPITATMKQQILAD